MMASTRDELSRLKNIGFLDSGVNMPLDKYIESVCDLNIGRVALHERPHKPALLLAIISAIEAGRFEDNRVEYGPELLARFRRFFDIVRGKNDSVNMMDPFWRLRTDGLLNHQPAQGFEAAVLARRDAPTVGELRTMCTFSRLPDDLYHLLQEPATRNAIREAIIHRYFAAHAASILDAISEEQAVGAYERILETEPARGSLPSNRTEEKARDQAFRRVVLRVYDYRCSACGLRVVVDDLVLVEAAHLVPFTVSQDDDPCNGIALCRNHHWAMDRSLIAPTSSLKWQVSAALDDRIEGQRDLLELGNKRLLLPRLERFHPKLQSLQWQETHLLAK